MKFQTQTSDFIKNDPPQKQHLMDHDQRWCLRNKHLTSLTHDASETPIWHHPPCWPRQYLTATTMKLQKHLTSPTDCHPTNTYLTNKHTSESLTLRWLRSLCQTQQWSPSETNIWWTTTNTETDGSSHCMLTIWKASPQNTQQCCTDPDLEGPADPNTQWVWRRAQWWDSATSLWSHHNNAVSATNGWQHSTCTRRFQQPQSWQPPTNCFSNKKTDSSHHNLKEEPSALRRLSIFDSTETEQKMHNGRRPVVEIAICM